VGPRLVSLSGGAEGARGRFQARSADGRRWRLALATRASPLAHRTELAAYRLASALELTIVPPTRLERLPLAQLSALLKDQDDTRAALAERAVVGNDGRIVALLEQECGGRPLFVGPGPPFSDWAKLAASPEQPSARDLRSVHDYVQMAVLDYLTGNVQRGIVSFDDDTGRLCVTDNTGAFPGYLTPQAQDLLLRRLRPLRQFPVGLDEALRQLDGPTAKRLLQNGAFSAWLVGPRQLTDLAERRSTLRTLLRAKVERYGTKTVFSLSP